MASTSRARIKSKRIRSNTFEWKVVVPSTLYVHHIFGGVDRYVNFSFFFSELSAFCVCNAMIQPQAAEERKTSWMVRIKYMQNWSQHGHICTMVVVHIVRIGHVAHFCRSGWTCFGFSFAFAFFIHSFFSLLSVKSISSLHVAVSWHGMARHGNIIIFGHRSILSVSCIYWTTFHSSYKCV